MVRRFDGSLIYEYEGGTGSGRCRVMGEGGGPFSFWISILIPTMRNARDRVSEAEVLHMTHAGIKTPTPQ